MKKKTKKTKETISKTKGPRPYKKCIQLIVDMHEEILENGDFSDEKIVELSELRKRLNKKEQKVVSALACSIAAPKYIDIDEASPGNELQMKI